jgi:hypothetical protein
MSYSLTGEMVPRGSLGTAGHMLTFPLSFQFPCWSASNVAFITEHMETLLRKLRRLDWHKMKEGEKKILPIMGTL